MTESGNPPYSEAWLRRRHRRRQMVLSILCLVGLATAVIWYGIGDYDDPLRRPQRPVEGIITLPAEVETKAGEEVAFEIAIRPGALRHVAIPSLGPAGEQEDQLREYREYRTLVVESARVNVEAVEESKLKVELLTEATQPVFAGDGKAVWNVRVKAAEPGDRQVLVDYEILYADGRVYDVETGRVVLVKTSWTFAYLLQLLSEKIEQTGKVLGGIVAIGVALAAIFSPRVRGWVKKAYYKVRGITPPPTP